MSSKIQMFFEKAVPYALVYGAIRKSIHVNQEISKCPFGTNKETEELYTTTKILLVTFEAFSNVYLWPTAIVRDVYAFEGFLRGHPRPPAKTIMEIMCR
jgi:hypothetical protein